MYQVRGSLIGGREGGICLGKSSFKTVAHIPCVGAINAVGIWSILLPCALGFGGDCAEESC